MSQRTPESSRRRSMSVVSSFGEEGDADSPNNNGAVNNRVVGEHVTVFNFNQPGNYNVHFTQHIPQSAAGPGQQLGAVGISCLADSGLADLNPQQRNPFWGTVAHHQFAAGDSAGAQAQVVPIPTATTTGQEQIPSGSVAAGGGMMSSGSPRLAIVDGHAVRPVALVELTPEIASSLGPNYFTNVDVLSQEPRSSSNETN